MKRYLLTTCFILTFAGMAYSQCVSTPEDPCVSVKQSVIDRAAKAADELLAARDAIAKFTAERTFTDAERRAAATLVDSLNKLVETGHRIQDEQSKVIALYKQVVEMQQTVIEKLEKIISKPKSGWGKFADALKTVANIALGIVIGRAGI